MKAEQDVNPGGNLRRLGCLQQAWGERCSIDCLSHEPLHVPQYQQGM
jgi:hypothetical protein